MKSAIYIAFEFNTHDLEHTQHESNTVLAEYDSKRFINAHHEEPKC